MAQQPTSSATPSSAAAAGHAVSLKVLRLSRPSLATQTALPPTSFGNGLDITSRASFAYPSSSSSSSSAHTESTFPLTPLLTLPAAFGAAYVGETFTCTLCANNEVREDEQRSVSGVRVTAELQTPSNQSGTTLELVEADDDDAEGASSATSSAAGDGGDVMALGTTMQKTLRHEMKEEGQHVLAVTVTYTETLRGSDGGASGGRVRTFRKLYQFVSQSLVAVRSKVTERKRRGKEEGRQWVLEAQLENVGEASVVLEKVWLKEREGIVGRDVGGELGREATVLKPQDVEQVMFVLEEKEAPDDLEIRVPLAQLSIDWRSAMGERGSLTTGWLASRGR